MVPKNSVNLQFRSKIYPKIDASEIDQNTHYYGSKKSVNLSFLKQNLPYNRGLRN